MRNINKTDVEWLVVDGKYTVTVRLLFTSGGSVVSVKTTTSLPEVVGLSIKAHNEAVELAEAISEISYKMQSSSNNHQTRAILATNEASNG